MTSESVKAGKVMSKLDGYDDRQGSKKNSKPVLPYCPPNLGDRFGAKRTRAATQPAAPDVASAPSTPLGLPNWYIL